MLLCGALACGDDDAMAPVDAGPPVETDAGESDAGPLEPTPFRVATWNVENFFDESNDPDREDDVLSASELAEKMANLAAVLTEIDADFVGLQEVENLALLERFADGPIRDLGYTERGLIDSFDGRGIDVAFLSRVPVTRVASHLGERFPSADGSEEYFWTRDALEVFVAPGGIELEVMVLHLRSRRGGNEDYRLAEALAARDLVERRLAIGQERILVIGDLNDEPGTPPLEALLDGPTLRDLTTVIPLADRWTFTFDRERQQLDHVLGTANLEPMRTDAEIVGGTDVTAASDHRPVVVDFVLEP